MAFLQTAPVLGNQYLDDRVLRSYLRRVLPPAVLGAIESDSDRTRRIRRRPPGRTARSRDAANRN